MLQLPNSAFCIQKESVLKKLGDHWRCVMGRPPKSPCGSIYSFAILYISVLGTKEFKHFLWKQVLLDPVCIYNDRNSDKQDEKTTFKMIRFHYKHLCPLVVDVFTLKVNRLRQFVTLWSQIAQSCKRGDNEKQTFTRKVYKALPYISRRHWFLAETRLNRLSVLKPPAKVYNASHSLGILISVMVLQVALAKLWNTRKKHYCFTTKTYI